MDAAFIGHLTADPKVSTYDSGKTKVQTRVAVNDSYVNNDGERVKLKPLFFTVEQWGEQAAEFAAGARTGSLVMVQGKWRADEWTVEGEDRRRQYVAADAMSVLPTKAKATSSHEDQGDESSNSASAADEPKWADAKP